MNSVLRAIVVFAAAISFAACSGTKPAPTAPPPVAASASNLTIDGFKSLSAKGEKGQLKALVTFSDGSVQDKSGAVQWSSTDLSVATVDNSGMVTAVSDGETTVAATFANVTGTRTILVDLPVDTP